MSSLFFYDPFLNFDRFFENAMSPFIDVAPTTSDNYVAQRAFRPRMDLHEDPEKNTVSATFELPGLNKDNVQIEVHDGSLTISAETKSSAEHEKGGYAVRERRFGKFSRSLRLPSGIKDKDVKAAMADGVLTITFPRSSPEQKPKRIAISSKL